MYEPKLKFVGKCNKKNLADVILTSARLSCCIFR